MNLLKKIYWYLRKTMNLLKKFYWYLRGSRFVCELCRLRIVLAKHLAFICISFIASFLMFYFPDAKVDFLHYLFVAIPVVIFFTIQFFIGKNVRFYLGLFTFLIVNLGVYAYSKYDDYVLSCPISVSGLFDKCDTTDSVYIIYGLFILSMFACLLICLFITYIWKCFKEKDNHIKENLFEERFLDLEQLISDLEKYDIIGIDADWGNGKSYVFSMLKERKYAYSYVKVGVLTTRVDTIESFIVNELSSALEGRGILSRASSKLDHILKNSIWHGIDNLFFRSKSYESLINLIKEELNLLTYPLIITFEDIDRINDTQILYKIFAITEVLKGGKVKIIYQYDEKRLMNLLGFKDHIFLEKYIPHSTHLTRIPFPKIAKKLINENPVKYKNIKTSDLDFISGPIYLSAGLSARFLPKRDFSKPYKLYDALHILDTSIRRIKLFLEEVNNALNDEQVNKNKRTVIVFFIIKFFYYDVFKKMDEDLKFTSTHKFICDKKIKKTIFELFSENVINDETKLEEFLKNDNNRIILTLLSLFDYKFSRQLQIDDPTSRQILYNSQPTSTAVEYDIKTDRVIRYLYCKGKAGFSVYEKMIKLLDDLVFSKKSEAERMSGYKTLVNKIHEFCEYENFEVPYLPTEIYYVPLFKAMSLVVDDQNEIDYWQKLIDFYKERRTPNPLDYDDFLCFRLVEMNRVEILVHLAAVIAEKKVECSFIKEKVFVVFVKKFILAIGNAGLNNYSATIGYSEESIAIEELKGFVDNGIGAMKKLSAENPLDIIKKRSQIICNALCVIKKSMECKNFYEKKKNDMKTEPPQKDTYDMIREDILKTNFGEVYVLKLLNNLYLDNFLTVSDVQNLWDEYQKRNRKAPSVQTALGKAKNAKKNKSRQKRK